MKKTTLTFSAVMLIAATACEENDPIYTGQQPPERVNFVTVDGDVSDMEVKRDFSWDGDVYGNFVYESNSFYDWNFGYNFNANWFSASYGGSGVINSVVNDVKMCTSFNCEKEDLEGNGVWAKNGVSDMRATMKWSYMDLDRKSGFIVIMEELPSQVQLISVPEVMSTTADNVIEFQAGHPSDSVLFELIKVPKENFGKQQIIGHLWSSSRYPIKAKDGKFLIPGSEILQAKVTDADSVFVNIVAVKRVKKVLNKKHMGITYTVNSIRPVRVE